MEKVNIILVFGFMFMIFISRTFPARNWSPPGYFRKNKYVPKPGEDRKISKSERKEAKLGPPK